MRPVDRHRRSSRIAIAALALVFCPVATADAGDIPYQIKASYIYNILQFVRFPPTQLGSEREVRVCILGEDRFGSALEEIDEAAVPQGHIEIIRLGRSARSETLNQCNAIYVVESERQIIERVLTRLDHNRVLTIGEFSSFIEKGGIIELYEENDSIRFRINPSRINSTEFKLDAQLVQLGVTDDG